MSSVSLAPALSLGFYPERRAPEESRFDRVAVSFLGNATRFFRSHSGRFKRFVDRVNALGPFLEAMSDAELSRQAHGLRAEYKSRGLDPETVARTYATVREFSSRTIGLRHFDVQILGGWVLLNGMLAEMDTGEGKTLTATLAASAAALAGVPVHIITVNDYLAHRDAETMRPIFESLNLTVAAVSHEMGLEERRRAYSCDITYCTNKEVVFDYLRDRLVMGQRPGHIQMSLERLNGDGARVERLRLRGLYFAIVDEADSILIDEARTPLIISGAGDNTFEAQVYQDALDVVSRLKEGEDYRLDLTRRSLEVTEAGKNRIEAMTRGLGSFWKGRLRREEMAHQALTAQHLFVRDRDYLVRDGKVQIIDEYTGRLMADRSWERGLHQLIETKEFCELTSQNETLTRISYQRFFRRYLHLAGMTGTAREVANEMWAVYRLSVVPIPTNRPVARRRLPTRVYRTAVERWESVVEKVQALHRQGRPVLVGTRSVGASEHLSALLSERSLPHRVLNARQDREEAEIISRAGQSGQITVATNMAGRGTDIRLGEGVKELGGLHVIATELHDARRIDRQLHGRCGRQGDPGSCETVASLEDDLLRAYLRTTMGRIVGRWISPYSRLGRALGGLFALYAQRSAERRHFQVRHDLLKQDDSLESTMSFSGLVE